MLLLANCLNKIKWWDCEVQKIGVIENDREKKTMDNLVLLPMHVLNLYEGES